MPVQEELAIPSEGGSLGATLTLPDQPCGLVVFAHGSGSSRTSPRNRLVAGILVEAGLATLLMDLLTPEEEVEDARTAALRFDIPLLAERLTAAVDLVGGDHRLRPLGLGLFGASTGAAAALVTAADRPSVARAVVSRGGRPDLARPRLPEVQAPTILIVGGDDPVVIEMNRASLPELTGAERRLEIVPGATHLFEEPGALEQVAELARDWFLRYLSSG
jgi:putative phosphoribosyl transferase